MSKHKEAFQILLIMLIMILVLGYGLGRIYGFVLFPDEFGYWAHAAGILGYDWSSITSLGSYYSFGYSVILIPIMALFNNAVIAYRAAVVVNAALLFFTFLLLIRIAEFIGLRRNVPLICAAVVFYPSYLVYMQMTMVEIPLMFAYTLAVYLFIRVIHRPKICNFVVLSIILVWMYSLHMRSIGVIVALILTLLFLSIIDSKYRKYSIFLVVLVFLGFVIMTMVKNYQISNLWTDTDRNFISENDYSGQIDKIGSLLTAKGIKNFLIGCIGKIFYLCIATVGTFYFAVIRLVGNVRSLKSNRDAGIFSLFILMSTAVEFQITALFLCDSSRVDKIIYGRYIEFILPPLIIIGAKEMAECRNILLKYLLMCVGLIISVPLMIWEIVTEKTTSVNYYFIIGTSLLNGIINTDTKGYFIVALVTGVSLSGILIVLSRRYKVNIDNYQIIILIMGINLLFGIHMCEELVYKNNVLSRGNVEIGNIISEHLDENRRVVLIKDGGRPFIDSIQFQLRNTNIIVMTEENSATDLLPNDIVILDEESAFMDTIAAKYNIVRSQGDFYLYINEE